jgi:hypothetical protein
LIREGFSPRVATTFRDLDAHAVAADLQRRRDLGQGNGAIVLAWRVEPPAAPAPGVAPVDLAGRAAGAKAQAIAIAPPDATPLEIQELALDLEEGATREAALARLVERRGQTRLRGAA